MKTTLKGFLDPRNTTVVETISTMIMELREFEGERLADAEEAVAQMMTRDMKEEDRRLRAELLRTVASSRMVDLPTGIDPEEIRREIFITAWERGYVPASPDIGLFSADRESVLQTVAVNAQVEPDLLSELMFADTPGERRLLFPSTENNQVVAEAIRMVNRERLRLTLRRAARLTLRLPARTHGEGSYVQLLWGAKRFGLMIDTSGMGDMLLLDIAGPHALFARTTMYWNRLFQFTLLVLQHAGGHWDMGAELLPSATNRPEAVRSLRLDASSAPLFFGEHPEPFTPLRSGDEEAFQKYFTKNAPHWNLVYEGALVPLRSGARKLLMVPDFVARSPRSSIEVLVEIMGFWRRDYLEKKIEKIRLMGERQLVLIVNAKLSVSREELVAPNAGTVRVFFYSNREELKQAAVTLAEKLERSLE
ncbi:MAG: DUF790 family protein [Bacteroidota bacterium]